MFAVLWFGCALIWLAVGLEYRPGSFEHPWAASPTLAHAPGSQIAVYSLSILLSVPGSCLDQRESDIQTCGGWRQVHDPAGRLTTGRAGGRKAAR